MNREARSIASKGRYGDDVLLHVNRRELEGLEQIVGRPLTYNPETGLPEAFGWQNIIPIVAGIAGGVVGGPLGAAGASAVASAGVSAAEGDDMQTSLTKGLVSGVTSYAGGQLLSGVGAAGNLIEGAGSSVGSNLIAPGVDAAQQAAVQGGVEAGTQAGAGAATGAATGTATGAATGAATATPAATVPVSMGPPTSPEYAFQAAGGQSYGDLSGDALRQVNTAYASQPYMDQAADVGRGLSSPEALGGAVRQNPMSAMTYAAGTYGQMSGMMNTPGNPSIGRDEYDPSKYPERFPAPRRANMPGSDYQAGLQPEWRYFAAGGLASIPTRNVPGYGEAENVVAEARAAMLGEHPARNDAMSRLRDRMGPEAVRAVREEGGRVRGAGGGLDDLVPGTIEGRQRVRLADGEFVVPSDVVSGLGDGSTDQGARKLHEMMNRVRMRRNGSKRQPGRTPRSAMPA